MKRARYWIGAALVAFAPPLGAQGIEKSVLADGVERWALPAEADAIPAFFRHFMQITGLQLPAVADLPFGRSIAFLVGVGRYPNLEAGQQLSYVQADVDALRDYLIGDGGFDEVLVARDEKASQELIEHYMMDLFPKRLGPRDRLLFYYSGHGSDAGGATGYLLLSGARKGEFSHEVIAISRVKEWSRVLRADHALFLFDSCSSGLGIAEKSGDFDSDQRLIQTLSRNGSRNAITAGTAEESTFEVVDRQGHGGEVFTRALLAALNNPTQVGPYASLLTVSQVFAQLELNVKRWAASEGRNLSPRIWPLDPNDFRGSFVFLNKASKEPVAEDMVSALKAQRRNAAPPGPAASWQDFAVSFRGSALRAKRLTLVTGAVPANATVAYDFKVQNVASHSMRLEFRVEGRGLEAAWEGGLWSRLVAPDSAPSFTVKVNPTNLTPSDRIVFLSAGQDLFSLAFDVLMKPAAEAREASSGSKPSGKADQWSVPYTLCLGPSPTGYSLDSAEYSLSGDRRCGQWAECHWGQRDDRAVCFDFRLQGHNEFPAILERGGSRDSEGHLRATYRLVAGVPNLVAAPGN